MPKKRKEGAIFTTISISWTDKNKLRGLARLVKQTKNGRVFESDSIVFKRILDEYLSRHPQELQEKPTSTYPSKTRDVSQQG
jgi:hypothetical protein